MPNVNTAISPLAATVRERLRQANVVALSQNISLDEANQQIAQSTAQSASLRCMAVAGVLCFATVFLLKASQRQ